MENVELKVTLSNSAGILCSDKFPVDVDDGYAITQRIIKWLRDGAVMLDHGDTISIETNERR